jgi:DNA-binding MarR family transcriptional regulator
MVGASTVGYRGDMTSRTGVLNRREQAAWRGLVSMQARLRSVLASELQRRFGLSEPDYAVLVELSEAPAGGLRLRDLGVRLAWEKSRVSKQIARMAARGLVERKGFVTDARGAVAVLTDAGRDVIARANPVHIAQVRKWYISALTPDQLDAMIEICAAISDNLARTDPQSSRQRARSPR